MFRSWDGIELAYRMVGSGRLCSASPAVRARRSNISEIWTVLAVTRH
jgi:hypothetical protein